MKLLRIDGSEIYSAGVNSLKELLVLAFDNGADLSGADLSGADLPEYKIIPEEGSFIAYKKLIEGVSKILIPSDARRTCPLVGRKCRSEFAVVLELPKGVINGRSIYYPEFLYKVGDTVRADSYDDDIRVECSHGIHFFITRKEAEEFN